MKGFKKGFAAIIVVIAVVLIALIVCGLFYFKQKTSQKTEPKTIDDLPVWLLRDGKVAVYREMEVGGDSVTANVVVSNLGNEDQNDVQIYETIPKEIAQSASTLEFSSEPEIIEDDPVVLWHVDNVPRSEPVTIGFSIKNDKDIVAMLENCKQEGTGMEKFEKEQKAREEMAKEFNMDLKNVDVACLRYWQGRYEWAQKQTEEKYQAQKEKIFKVLNVKDSEYKKIQTEAKKVISEVKKKEADKNQTAQSVAKTIPISESIFPNTLIGYSLSQTNSPAIEGSCYEKASPKKYISAYYQKDDSTMAVAVTEYDNSRNAQATARICSSYMEEEVLRPTMGAIATVEKKDDVSGQPFYITYAEREGQKTIFAAFSSVGNYLVAMMKSEESGGAESEYREAIGTMINIISGKEKSTESSSTPTSSSVSLWQEVDLAGDFTNYVYSKSVTPCSNYFRKQTEGSYSVRCATNADAQWRELSVKEISTNGAGKIGIRASLGLKDYASFFGKGVKADDYVSLLVLSSDPKSALASECNKTVSEEDWSKCSVNSEGPAVLGHCGVPAFSESENCDFEVETGGLGKIYLVFRVADAWLADVEGSIASLEILPK